MTGWGFTIKFSTSKDTSTKGKSAMRYNDFFHWLDIRVLICDNEERVIWGGNWTSPFRYVSILFIFVTNPLFFTSLPANPLPYTCILFYFMNLLQELVYCSGWIYRPHLSIDIDLISKVQGSPHNICIKNVKPGLHFWFYWF